MKIIHFCAGLEGWNGMANTARQFVAEELARGDDSQLTNDVGVVERTENVDRVHIHGTWLPVLWKVAKLAKKKGAELIVRPCGNYDPIRIRRGAVKRLKKWLVGPFEHAMLNRADFVQCTCAAEAEWVKAYHPKARIQMTDLKRFFDLGVDGSRSRTKDGSLHVLYLGRRDPLKGVEFLERAVAEIQVKVRGAIERSEIAEGLREQRRGGISAGVEKDRRGLALRNKQTPPPKFRPLTEVVETVAKHQAAGFSPSTTVNSVANLIGPRKGAVREIGLGRRSRSTVEVELRIVSDHFGEELEKDWDWCDVLVLPTLSENFGRVVAEALERGKRVVTTDGAPAWGEGELFECSECSNVRMSYGGRLVYLKGFRDGTDEERVRLLKDALGRL